MDAVKMFIAIILATVFIDAAPMIAQTLSLTTNGTGGVATYSGSTGILNIPQYMDGNGVSSVRFQNYIQTTNSGITLDASTPAYGTQVYGNYFFISNFQNGLYGGAVEVNEQSDMIGDQNSIINSYRAIRGGTATLSDEGMSIGVVAHNYVNSQIGASQYLMYQGVISNNVTPVAYGPSILTISGAPGWPAIASTMLFDLSNSTSNTITAISGSGGATPYTATVSTAVSVSTSATLSTDLCNYNGGTNQCNDFSSTQALNPSPVLTSFTVDSSDILTAGEICQFVDTNPNLAESTMIVSAPGVSGSQAVTAYLTLPHFNGTQMYCGDMVGKGLVFNADDHGGQLYGFHIYGAPTSTTLLIGDRTLGSQYGNGSFAAQPGAVTIYPAATVISNINPSTGKPDPTYAQIMYPSSSFVPGDAVANPGFASSTTYYDRYAAYLDDPYNQAEGFSYTMNGLGFNWITPLYTYSLGYGSAIGTPVDFVTFLGDDSVASGFSWTTQLTGSRSVPNLGGVNCVICFTGWDHTSGLKTQQSIFWASEGGSSNLFFDDADYSLNYNHSVKAYAFFDTSLGPSSSPLCTTTGGQLTNSGCAGVPSVNGITSAVTVAAGTGVSVGTSGGIVTVTNTQPLTSATLESVLSSSPFNISAASNCAGKAVFSAMSPDGVVQCDTDVSYVSPGYWLFGNNSGAGGMQLNGAASSLNLLSNQPSFFGAGLQLMGDDTGFDAGSGTEYIYNAAGQATVIFFGAHGSGSFSGPVVANIYQETLTTPSSSAATCTAGQFTDDANYHYVCVATNTWKRVALSSF